MRRLLVLALCAGLAAALPTGYDTEENEVGTEVLHSSVTRQASSHAEAHEQTSYYYSTEGESIIEITVAEAADYGLVCVPSKQLVESAHVIVQETHDELVDHGSAKATATGDHVATGVAEGHGAHATAEVDHGSATSTATGDRVATGVAEGHGAHATAEVDHGSATSTATGDRVATGVAEGHGAHATAEVDHGSATSTATGDRVATGVAEGHGATATAEIDHGSVTSTATGDRVATGVAEGHGATATAEIDRDSVKATATGDHVATAVATGDKATTTATIYVSEDHDHDELDKCVCVPYFLCKDENIVSDGAGEIDIRFGAGSGPTNSKCRHVEAVCCLHPESQPVPEYVAELTAEPYQPKCGQRNQEGFGFQIDGFKDSESQFSEFPHMAIIMEEEYIGGQLRHRYVCGGSLITKSVILTAGHCVAGKSASKLVVRLGDWNTKTITELLPHQEYKVSKAVVHEKLNKRTLFNTVALLFLDHEVNLQPHVDTICLPSLADVAYGHAPFYDAAHCVATGFGRDQFEGGEYQNIMKQVDLAEVEHDDCEEKLRKTRLGRWFRLHKSFTCAGGKPGMDTCRGDGGSPLICPLLSDPYRYVQIGIVAWGIGCGEAGVPGVYASVTELLPWIYEHLQDDTHTTEELVEPYDKVQVCVTKNPFTEADYQEEIPIKVGHPPPPPPKTHHDDDDHGSSSEEHYEQQNTGY